MIGPMQEPPGDRAGVARRAIEELVDLLQVLALSIDASQRDPTHRLQHIDIPYVARRVLVTAEKVASLLVAHASEQSTRD